ncbi:hypothetical protein EGT45_05990 [Yersinia pestis]|nr:hypothetical protein EGT45_05990 [Yersinia pestis]ROZ96575.1 hypothetical protein EGT46_16795 [Yersinia pestis]
MQTSTKKQLMCSVQCRFCCDGSITGIRNIKVNNTINIKSSIPFTHQIFTSCQRRMKSDPLISPPTAQY